MVLEVVVFDLGGTLVHLDGELEKIVAEGHRALTEFLNRAGYNIGLQDVNEVSVRIFDAYDVFAETSLVDVGARVLVQVGFEAVGRGEFHGGIANRSREELR